MNNFKVITKEFLVEDKVYVVVKIDTENGDRFGTIDYDLLDSAGRLKKAINGITMMLEDSLEKALNSRKMEITINKMIQDNKNNGLSDMEAMIKAYREYDG